MFLIASMAFGVSIFMMLYIVLTNYAQKQTFLRRLNEHSRSPKKKAKYEGSTIDSGELESSFSKVRKSLMKSLVMAFLFSFPIAYGWYYVDPKIFPNKWVMVLLVVTIIFRFRHLRTLKRYDEDIEEDLPRVMDLLIICIEAGMSINSALMRVADETKGSPISNEFRETFQELNAGVSVEDAFINLSERTNVPDLQGLTTSIVQSEKLGTGLVETMRGQAVLMRETMRLRTKEKIMKLPVKMLLPLVVFILPAVFTILAGPIYLQVQGSFFDSLSDAKPGVEKAKEGDYESNY